LVGDCVGGGVDDCGSGIVKAVAAFSRAIPYLETDPLLKQSMTD
jgi:hypothetical protein